MLGYDQAQPRYSKRNPNGQCRQGECARCDWNPEEAARRRKLPMRRFEDGRKGIVIPQKMPPEK